jgi:hypothetical protein
MVSIANLKDEMKMRLTQWVWVLRRDYKFSYEVEDKQGLSVTAVAGSRRNRGNDGRSSWSISQVEMEKWAQKGTHQFCL